MKNKHIAIALFASLVSLGILPLIGVNIPAVYIVGALAGLIFAALGLSRLHLKNKKAFFPYFGGIVVFVFWSYAMIDTDSLILLAPLYMITLIITGVKLYRL